MTGLVIQSPGVCSDRTLPMRNPLWTPALLPGRKLDLDCDTAIVTNGSSEVTSWTDQAQGIVFTPTAADKRPVRNYAFEAHLAPRFTLDALQGSASISATAAHWCWWAVIDQIDLTTSALQNLVNVPGASPNTFAVYSPATNGNIRGAGAGVGNFEPGAVVAGKQILIISQQAAGTRNLRRNGAQLGSAQTGLVVHTLGTPIIGLYDPGVKDCAVASMGFAAGVQNLADIQKLEGYLAQRYMPANFLPADHPYRTVAPRKLT
jgi:hypothetical protein